VFVNPKTEVRVVVHGDDFTMSGMKEELAAMRGKMQEWYEVNDRGIMGSGVGEIREVTILGRTVRWTPEGIEYEADERHRQELMNKSGLEESSKAAVGPVAKGVIGDEKANELELEGKARKAFRGNALC